MSDTERPQPSELDENFGTTFAATLADEWAERGVTDVVVCPGSRSTPLAIAVAEHPGLRVHVHHDERSGGFMGLGLGIGSGRPAVVITTSGTAAVELHPAVVEAHHQCVPLLVVTADRPPELQGVGAPQTINQRELYGDCVRWFVEPGPPTAEGRSSWRSLAAYSVMATTGGRPGPVHLNLAFREPLVGPCGQIPPPDDVDPQVAPAVWGLLDEEVARLAPLLDQRGLIVCGARAALSSDDVDVVQRLAELLGWPVVADAMSGLRTPHPNLVTVADPVLRHDATAEALRPQVILRIGGLLASRVVNEWLSSSGAVHIGLDRYGLVPDPDHVLASPLHGDVAESVLALIRATEHRRRNGSACLPDPAWIEAWQAVEAAGRGVIDVVLAASPASEPATVASVLADLPAGSDLVVSSSMPIRDLEWYAPAREGVRVISNRGANGIDGVTSTAVGVSLAGSPTTLVIGDVAFLHDTNGLLGLAARPGHLDIVVIDNDGGGIFSFLPQHEVLSDARFEQLYGTPHGVDVAALAAVHGITIRVVDGDRSANLEFHRQLNAAVVTALEAIV